MTDQSWPPPPAGGPPPSPTWPPDPPLPSGPPTVDPAPAPDQPSAPVPWQRLDSRMLLVHPIRELLRFLPALAGLWIAGGVVGGLDLQWQLLGVVVPVVLGVARYLTTAYRITDDRVELRRGLLDRHLLSTRIERVRTVDLTSSPIHRLLGLTTVRIGTGTASTSEEDQVDLDGLRTEQARALRVDLLRETAAGLPEGGDDVGDAAPAPPVLVLDPRWARYAPATATGVVITAAGVGVAAQGLEVAGDLGEGNVLEATVRALGLVLLPLALVTILAVVAVVSVGAYLVTNWGFTLTHERGSWHLRRGLITTRETSLDDERVAGVSVGEPAGLRLVGAARLSAIVTGLDRGQAESSVLVPPAPRAVADGVATTVVGSPAAVTGPLRPHGPAAVRRVWVRALVPSAVVATGLLVLAAVQGWAWLVVPAVLAPVVGVALARDRARGLGHALVGHHVVARSGSLLRQRQVLAVDDVIGWSFRATWLQRRVGLTTLVATTAGGPQAVAVPDVPEGAAVALSATASPGLLTQFLERAES